MQKEVVNINLQESYRFLDSWQQKDKPILVMGDVGLDQYTEGEVNRISPEAPVGVLEVKRQWNKLGLAANVSDNLAALEIPSLLISVVGADRNAQELIGLVRERKFITDKLFVAKHKQTIKKERILTPIQQICRIDYEDKLALGKDIEDEILSYVSQNIKNYSACVLEDYGKGLFSKNILQEMIQLFCEHQKPIVVDPSRKTRASFYKKVPFLKPNWQEAQILLESLIQDGLFQTKKQVDDFSVEEVMIALIENLELEKIVITLGAKGMALYDKNEKNAKISYIETNAKEVFDVSGAGDTTVSILIAALAKGASLKEAAVLANIGAGVVVEKRGTATCNRDELKNFLI